MAEPPAGRRGRQAAAAVRHGEVDNVSGEMARSVRRALTLPRLRCGPNTWGGGAVGRAAAWHAGVRQGSGAGNTLAWGALSGWQLQAAAVWAPDATRAAHCQPTPCGLGSGVWGLHPPAEPLPVRLTL